MWELWDRFCGNAKVQVFVLRLFAAALIAYAVYAAYDMLMVFVSGSGIFINIGILLAFVGHGLLNYRSWTRRLSIFLCVLAIIGAVTMVIGAFFLPNAMYGLLYDTKVYYFFVIVPFALAMIFCAFLTVTVLCQKEIVARFERRQRREHWTQILLIVSALAIASQAWQLWQNDRFIRGLKANHASIELVVCDAQTREPVKRGITVIPPPAVPGDIYSAPVSFRVATDPQNSAKLRLTSIALKPFTVLVSAKGYRGVEIMVNGGEPLPNTRTLYLEPLPKTAEVGL